MMPDNFICPDCGFSLNKQKYDLHIKDSPVHESNYEDRILLHKQMCPLRQKMKSAQNSNLTKEGGTNG